MNIFLVIYRRGALCISQGRRMGNPACHYDHRVFVSCVAHSFPVWHFIVPALTQWWRLSAYVERIVRYMFVSHCRKIVVLRVEQMIIHYLLQRWPCICTHTLTHANISVEYLLENSYIDIRIALNDMEWYVLLKISTAGIWYFKNKVIRIPTIRKKPTQTCIWGAANVI